MSKDIGRLSRLGFSSLPECLLSTPKEYRDCLEPMHVLPIADTGIKVYMVLTLTDRALFDRTNMPTSSWKRCWRLSMRGVDGRGQGVDITVFGSCFPWMEHQPGDELHLYGQVTTYKGKLQIGNPDLVPPEQRGRIVPIYAGKPGQVSGESLSKGVSGALSSINEAACMLLAQSGMREAEFRRRAGMDPEMLLTSLHRPKSTREGKMAAKVAADLSLAAILGRAARNQAAAPVTESALPIDRAVIQSMCARLPFSLTGDQVRAIDEIVGDLRAPFPMRRLLSGDVGTGKSIVFMVPAVAAFNAGARVAIVAPTQLLVEQIVGEIRAYFPEVPVQEVTSGARVGAGLLVGTSALIHAARRHKIEFDVVIVDEQHKFSVDQKEALRVARTNLLEATATAIPRTLALVGFGGMTVSVLRELPVTKRIATRIVEKEDGARLFGFIHAQIEAGGQVAVIYPLAEDLGDGERASVEAAFERFKARYGERAGMLHGKLLDGEKTAVINKMKAGEISLLVSSTVIEVGVTLPSLRALVVVHPERFGVSQLHQLRGRVARKGGAGYCFLYLPSEVEDMALERLELLVEYSDGFTLAERDADLRGFGNVDAGGDAQSGASRLLFWGVNLTRQDIEQGAERLGLLEPA